MESERRRQLGGNESYFPLDDLGDFIGCLSNPQNGPGCLYQRVDWLAFLSWVVRLVADDVVCVDRYEAPVSSGEGEEDWHCVFSLNLGWILVKA